jgi:hypothetical protein
VRHLQGNGLPATVQAKKHLPVLPGLGLLMRAPKLLLASAVVAFTAYLVFATSMGAPVRFLIEEQMLRYPCPPGTSTGYLWYGHPVHAMGCAPEAFDHTLCGTCKATLTITGG